jgi:hypothetical protein
MSRIRRRLPHVGRCLSQAAVAPRQSRGIRAMAGVSPRRLRPLLAGGDVGGAAGGRILPDRTTSSSEPAESQFDHSVVRMILAAAAAMDMEEVGLVTPVTATRREGRPGDRLRRGWSGFRETESGISDGGIRRSRHQTAN